jgi:hypothetical protein
MTLADDWAEWGRATHRYPASRVEYWRAQMEADPAATVATIKALTSVHIPSAVAAGPPAPAGGVNPLVAEIARSRPALFRLASAEGPPPDMFVSGPVPPFVASGDERILAALPRIPWQARHAVASATTAAEALAIVEDVSGPDGELAAAKYAGHAGVRDYEQRVRDWATGRLTALSSLERQQVSQADRDTMEAELYREMFGPDRRP